MNKGSILILAIVATLILSIIMAAGLMVTTTETATTQNLYMNRIAYYTVVQGVEQVTNLIRLSNNPSYVTSNEFPESYSTKGGFVRKYITGTMEDLQSGSVRTIEIFKGFSPPPIPNTSQFIGLSPVIWHVKVTSEIAAGRKKAYSEVEAGIYSLVYTGY